MTSNTAVPSENPSRPGRAFLFLGLLAVLAGPVIFTVQLVSHSLTSAWYFPTLVTLGALLLLGSLVQRRTVLRGIVVGISTLFAGLAWLIVFGTPTPSYIGPVTVGETFPSFETRLASGGSFEQGDLKGGKDTVLVFFRGKW